MLSCVNKASLFWYFYLFLYNILCARLPCISCGSNINRASLLHNLKSNALVLLNMPAASATAKMSFSVLRRLKTCVSSAMKNNRLSSLGLMHIHRDFEVNLYKTMEVFVSAKTGRAHLVKNDYGVHTIKSHLRPWKYDRYCTHCEKCHSNIFCHVFIWYTNGTDMG